MKTITYNDIVYFGPCYDPDKFIPKDFSGTLLDILRMEQVPARDRLWLVVRAELLTGTQLKKYALACARMVENNTADGRVKECNDVVARFLSGNASAEELTVAKAAADSAAFADTRAAADSAWSAADSAASAAAFADTRAAYLARAAADSAADSAVAAWSAADFAFESANSASRCATDSADIAAQKRAVANEKQCLILIEILESGDDK